MAKELVSEWQSASGRWYVADVHTWTGWRECAKILDIEENVEVFSDYLRTQRGAMIDNYVVDKDLLIFYWTRDSYAKAHKFKLDVNRIGRKKGLI